MKRVLLYVTLLTAFIANSQGDYEGLWNGQIMGMPLVFEINKDNGNYTARMQSPKQSPVFLPADDATIKNDSIYIKLTTYKISFKGKLDGDQINGVFSQGMGQFPLVLNKGGYEEQALLRPQEPMGNPPYKVEEVSFDNKAAKGVRLAGTLTLPVGVSRPPVVVLISGSGPQNRNEELAGHKPFLLWADHLTKSGIAVLRFDDRGTAQSTGDHNTATSADFATDVSAAVDFLKTRTDIDKNEIGLMGHSEGGLIAPMVIANRPRDIAFFISLAGPGVSGYDVLVPQLKKSTILAGVSEQDAEDSVSILAAGLNEVRTFKGGQSALKSQMLASMKAAREKAPSHIKVQYNDQLLNGLAQQFSSDWMRFFIKHDPSSDLRKIQVPSLLLNGSLDYQIIPEDNLYIMKDLIKSNGNDDVTAIELESMNHLFQKVKTGAASEYETTQETINPEVLEIVSKWINERF